MTRTKLLQETRKMRFWVKNTLQSGGLVVKTAAKARHRKRRKRAPLPDYELVAEIGHGEGSKQPPPRIAAEMVMETG